MAVTLPLLVMLITGIVSYGSWLFMAHDLQQAANGAARSAVAGLSVSERAHLVETRVATNLRRSGTLDPDRVGIMIDDNGDTIVVHLSYDVSDNPLMKLSVIPVPSGTIERSAAVELSGL